MKKNSSALFPKRKEVVYSVPVFKAGDWVMFTESHVHYLSLRSRAHQLFSGSTFSTEEVLVENRPRKVQHVMMDAVTGKQLFYFTEDRSDSPQEASNFRHASKTEVKKDQLTHLFD